MPRKAHGELTRRAGELADAPGILEDKLAVALEQEHGAAEARAAMTVLAPSLIETFHSGSESIRALRLGVDPTHPRELVARAADIALLSQQRCEDLENWLAAIAAGSAPADPSLAEMMADVRMVEQRWQELGKVGVEDEPDVVEARRRHDQLLNRLGALEELAESGILADRARAEIDDAHRERAEAEDERHVRSGALDTAIENEHRVVGLYGFDSYLEYTIAVSTRSVGEAVEATLERVRAESVGAADALEAVRASAAAVRATIAEDRATLRDRIRTQTGVDADELTVDVLAQVPELPGSLEGIESEVEATLAWAAQEAVRCSARVEELERERDQAVDPVPGLLSEAEASLRRAAALEPLVERATEDHRSVQREIEETERLVAEAGRQLAAIDADIESAATSGDQGYTLGDITSIVGAMTPSIDQPGPDPIPVLMIDAFGPLAAMATNALEATMAAAVRVQLVYVTDDPVVIDWADRLSSSAGQLVRLGRPSWFQRRLARRQTRRMSHQQ